MPHGGDAEGTEDGYLIVHHLSAKPLCGGDDGVMIITWCTGGESPWTALGSTSLGAHLLFLSPCSSSFLRALPPCHLSIWISSNILSY